MHWNNDAYRPSWPQFITFLSGMPALEDATLCHVLPNGQRPSDFDEFMPDVHLTALKRLEIHDYPCFTASFFNTGGVEYPASLALAVALTFPELDLDAEDELRVLGYRKPSQEVIKELLASLVRARAGRRTSIEELVIGRFDDEHGRFDLSAQARYSLLTLHNTRVTYTLGGRVVASMRRGSPNAVPDEPRCVLSALSAHFDLTPLKHLRFSSELPETVAVPTAVFTRIFGELPKLEVLELYGTEKSKILGLTANTPADTGCPTAQDPNASPAPPLVFLYPALRRLVFRNATFAETRAPVPSFATFNPRGSSLYGLTTFIASKLPLVRLPELVLHDCKVLVGAPGGAAAGSGSNASDSDELAEWLAHLRRDAPPTTVTWIDASTTTGGGDSDDSDETRRLEGVPSIGPVPGALRVAFGHWDDSTVADSESESEDSDESDP